MHTLADIACYTQARTYARLWKIPAQLATGITLLAVLTLGIYYPALHSQLVADDFFLVGQVSFPDAISYFRKSFGFGRNEYRPVTALSYAVDRAVWGANPEGYHVTNLALHAATAGLLFLFLEALTLDFPLALLAGFLFIIHPINSSRAIWISARDGSLCAIFLLGALWLFLLARRKNRRTLCALSVGMALCALLAYEGAVIVPVLISAVELIFLAKDPLRARIASCARNTAPFWILTAAYLGFWEIIFAGKIGAYDLSFRPLAILDNYARLLSDLFYGNKEWLLLLGYIALLILCYRALMASRWLIVFGVVVILIGFLPYCFTDGFAYRFGYISALGISILLSACIMAGIRATGRLRVTAAACLGILVCAFYTVRDQRIASDWSAAGKIAAGIPRAVEKLRPRLPEGAVLVFAGIPRVHGHAYVFPTGLDAAIQREYPVKVFVRQYDRPMADTFQKDDRGAIVFKYCGGRNPLRTIESAPHDE